MPPPLDSPLVKALLARSPAQTAAIEAAVNQQLIHGGALDTLLLESKIIDEPSLAALMSEVSHTAPVSLEQVRAPSAAAVARLPRRMAVAMALVPLFVDDDASLHVACGSPLDKGLIDEVSGLLQQPVIPHVVPEVRLRQGLLAAYEHPLDERFITLLRQVDPTASEGLTPVAGPASSASEAVVSWDLVEALAHLAAQDSRDGIGRVAVAYARKFLPFAAVFGVRDGACVGWHREGPADGVAFTQPFPVPDDSFVKAALSSSSPLLLRPDTADGTLAFLGWVGRRRPQTALVVPIIVGTRAVGALYADGGVRHRDPREVGELTAFAARLGPALEALLRKRHRQHPSIFPTPAATIPPAPTSTMPPAPSEPPTTITTEDLPAPPPLDDVSAAAVIGKDGTSPFARGYAPQRTPTPEPVPAPAPAEADSVPPLEIVVTAPTASFMLTGIAPPLNEHSKADASSTNAVKKTPSSFFPLPEERATEAWQSALKTTVERGLQGGSAPAVDDDDDWESVVYDPAHAKELDAVPTVAPAKKRDVVDFPTLSTATLADVIDDLDQAAERADKPSTIPPLSDDVETPLAAQSHKDLVELLFAGDDAVVLRAQKELSGRGLAAVPALGDRFPGRLKKDPFDPGENVRQPAQLGPLVEVLARLGKDGLDAAIPHVDSRYPAHRFAAVLLFAHTPDARAIDLLRNRLHDAEPRIQRLAQEALVPFLSHARFEGLLLHLRERTTAVAKPYPLEARKRAAELLGEFRDVGAVPLLVSLLAYPEMQETARQALRVIALQDLGARGKAWEKWWAKAKKRSRIDWLIDGLASEELALRQLAHRELAALTGDDFGYRPDADKRARGRAVDAWQTWWEQEQRAHAHPKAAARL